MTCIRHSCRMYSAALKGNEAAKGHFTAVQPGMGLLVSYLADARNFMLLYGKSLSFSTCAQEWGEEIACCNLRISGASCSFQSTEKHLSVSPFSRTAQVSFKVLLEGNTRIVADSGKTDHR